MNLSPPYFRRKTLNRAVAGTLSGLAIACDASNAHAQQVFNWVSPADAFFSAPASWSPLGSPGEFDFAHFFLNQPYAVNFVADRASRQFLVGAGQPTFTAANPVTYDLDPVPGAPCVVDGTGTLTLAAGPMGQEFLMRILNPELPLFVGSSGIGVLSITEGTRLESQAPIILADTATGFGQVNVNGAGARLVTQSANLNIGDEGFGALTIFSGGVAEIDGAVFVGGGFGSSGTASVGGPGSMLQTTELPLSADTIFIGHEGEGALTISSGATVRSGGDVRIASDIGGSGIVTVTGLASLLEANTTEFSELSVGGIGPGTLNILNGAHAISGQGILGIETDSNGSVTIDGAGSAWMIESDLLVGRFGTGDLTIRNGASMSSTTGRIAGFNPSADGQVIVTDPGSTWTNADRLDIGDEGDGELIIANGGTVSSFSATITPDSDGSGAVTVTGPGSMWMVSDELIVGEESSGGLLIANGGTVQAAVVTISNGFVILDGGTLSALSIDLPDGGLLFSQPIAHASLDAAIDNEGALIGPLQIIDVGPEFDPAAVELVYLQLTGDVEGDGVYGGNIQFSASFDPGPGIDVIGSTGNIEFDATSHLYLDIQGSVPDSLIVTGIARLAGTLNLRTCCEFQAVIGEQFEILNADLAVVGTFDTVSAPTLPEGLTFDVIYGDNTVTLEVIETSSCPADLDSDGTVGAADLATLLGSWGPTPGSAADLDGDGSVGAADLAQLLGAWGPCL